MTAANPPVLLTVLLLLLLVGCAPVFTRPGVATFSPSSEQASAGEIIFFEQCHACHPHGGRGLGRGVTDRPLPAFMIRLQVREGLGAMPAFGPEEIDDEELDALVVYLAELREFWARSEGGS